jgi:tRNA pseudouridine55 synthase
MKGRRHAQTPPFSAKKIAGIPAHRLARKGQPVELKPKQVEIKELEFYDCGGLEQLERAPSTNTLNELFLHPRLVLPEFPAVVASPESAARMRHGRAVNLPEFSKVAIVRVFAGQRELLAIARRVAGTLFQPKVVLQG